VGLAFAQVVHAAGESSDGTLAPGTYAVALGVPDEPALKALADHLESLGVPIHRVEEATGKYAGQLMALGVEPGPKSERGRHLSHLPLLKAEYFPEFRVLYRQWAEAFNKLQFEKDLTWTQRLSRWWKGSK
jgi:hypothetical protein